MSETAVRSKGSSAVSVRHVGPLPRVADEAVADLDQLVGLGLSERRSPAPAQKDGQPGHEERVDDARGGAGAEAAEAERDDLGGDVPALLAQRKGEHADGRVDPILGVGLGEEQDPARGMALAETRERLDRGLLPLAGHPRHVGHHARPQVRSLGLVRRLLTQAAQGPHDVVDADVLARPLLDVGMRRAQWRSHSRPSRRISSSAAAGPQVPAA